MNIDLCNKLNKAVERTEILNDTFNVHIDGHYVDSPSSNFNCDDTSKIVSVDTEVMCEYPISSSNVYPMLSLKGLDESDIIRFLTNLVEELKEIDKKEVLQ